MSAHVINPVKFYIISYSITVCVHVIHLVIFILFLSNYCLYIYYFLEVC